jgi:23S rRNA pseudouridine2605 synthase
VTSERLQKILSQAGVASRRRAEELIVAGRVAVNGEVVTTLGARANPDEDTVLVDGVPVNRQRFRYVAVNKPRGVLTTMRDDRGRVTVMDMLADDGAGLHPIGRLDRESEGLLIATNDGTLTQLLTHPSHRVEKEYLVEIDQPLARETRERLVRGVLDDGERLRARRIETVEPDTGGRKDRRTWVSVTLTEGKKREIRRMMTQVGREVRTLRRVRIGPVVLADLPAGRWRALSSDEVSRLYRVATGEAGPRRARS